MDIRTPAYILLTIIFTISCKESKKKEDIAPSNVTNAETVISGDSLVKQIFQFTESYFRSNSIDSIVASNGRPKYMTRIEWGDHVADSLLTIGYDFLKFDFWESTNSKPELANVILYGKNVTLPGNLAIGKTTRQDIIQSLGLPDGDHNDPGRSMTKSGDSTVYGTKSGAGDTVTFTYYINIDEYAIGFAMTKDTLREISWSKNPY